MKNKWFIIKNVLFLVFVCFNILINLGLLFCPPEGVTPGDLFCFSRSTIRGIGVVCLILTIGEIDILGFKIYRVLNTIFFWIIVCLINFIMEYIVGSAC